MRGIPYIIACVGTLALVGSWHFYEAAQGESQTLHHLTQEKNRILKVCRTSQQCLERAPDLRDSLNRSRLQEPASLEELRSVMKDLGQQLHLTKLELSIDQDEDALPTRFPRPILSDRMRLLVQGPSDQAVFMFMDALEDAISGVIIYETFTLDRVDAGDTAFVEGEMILSWIHTPEEEET